MPEHQNIEYKESWRDKYLNGLAALLMPTGAKSLSAWMKGNVTGLHDKGSEIDRKFSVKNLEKIIHQQKIKNLLYPSTSIS